MSPETISVSVTEQDSVTALLYAAKSARKNITLILGHGAGGNQLSPFMRLFADGLAKRGIDTITFNFLYSEKRRSAPDHKTKLEACYRAIIQAARAHKKLKKNRLVIGGKSMGGRIASQVAAEDSSGLSGLVFLGYPLHPPGKPEQMRDAHLKDIAAPMLFLQGTKDPFASPDELRAVTKKLKVPTELKLIEKGDHSLKVTRTPAQADIYESVMDQIKDWIAGL